MANADTRFGLKPIGPGAGSTTNGKVVPMYLQDGYATNAFIGDPVIKVAGGSNDVAITVVGGGTFEIGTLPDVEVATVGDGNEITGVIVGFLPTNRDSNIYGAASTHRVALVNTDPYQEYLIQADGAVPAASVGLNAVLIATHSGSTTTGLSGMELDTTSDVPAADASNQLLIMRHYNAPDNEVNLIHNKIVVRVNISTEAADRAGLLGI